MDNRVPLHALVLVLLRDHTASVSEACRRFPAHEVITPERIATDLVGQPERPDLAAITLHEMQRRVSLKLSLGERVVVATPGLIHAAQRMAFARLAVLQGAAVVYLLDPGTDEAALRTGDGFAQVVFATQTLCVVLPLPANALTAISQQFQGLTVLGDVHGDLAGLRSALSWARARNHFVWLLGDIIDCGPHSLETLVMVYHLVMHGEAGFILGNHERKIARWLAQNEIGEGTLKLSPGNRVTVNALQALSAAERRQWSGKFRSLLSRASLINHLGSATFVHAAVHPDVWSSRRAATLPRSPQDQATPKDRPTVDWAPDDQAIENFALYGEHHSRALGLTHRWVDAIPDGHTVFVGHDIRSMVAPLVVKGRNGGQVVFLDTGAGNGGRLSSADLRFIAPGGLRLENFNRH